ncbi:hypothetical protein M885DRAFT_509761 [Pelagophyceae sp. CCMP2097]|nr:hypothetical protein M885DRAFT_509761 [Pelagophyceae sp. CCMP2097]
MLRRASKALGSAPRRPSAARQAEQEWDQNHADSEITWVEAPRPRGLSDDAAAGPRPREDDSPGRRGATAADPSRYGVRFEGRPDLDGPPGKNGADDDDGDDCIEWAPAIDSSRRASIVEGLARAGGGDGDAAAATAASSPNSALRLAFTPALADEGLMRLESPSRASARSAAAAAPALPPVKKPPPRAAPTADSDMEARLRAMAVGRPLPGDTPREATPAPAPAPAAAAAAGPEDDAGAPAASRRRRVAGERVAALVEGFESLAAAAEAEAQRQAALMFERDPAKARRGLLALRRRAAAAASEAARAGAGAQPRCAAPKFANVAGAQGRIVVQLTCATPASGVTISYCVVESDGAEGARPGSWKSAAVARRRAQEHHWEAVASGGAVTLAEPGRYVVLARATAAGLADSVLASSVWWLAPAEVLQHESHAHALQWTAPAPAHGRCAVCADRLTDRSCYTCSEHCACFVLCQACAFDHGTRAAPPASPAGGPDSPNWRGAVDVPDSPNFGRGTFDESPAVAPPPAAGAAPFRRPPPPPPARGARPPLSVALDAGAKRIWLSEPIEFEGNRAAIKLRSFPMLSLLAGTLRRNAGLCVRLEGHTNSKCGAECDGSSDCPNATCRNEFGFGRGGAMGFSLARAESVRDWLISPAGGNLGSDARDRVTAVGHGGSRRLADDTQGPENHLNRRVETHIVEF